MEHIIDLRATLSYVVDVLVGDAVLLLSIRLIFHEVIHVFDSFLDPDSDVDGGMCLARLVN